MDWGVGVGQTLGSLSFRAFILKETYMHIRDGSRIPSSIRGLFGKFVRYTGILNNKSLVIIVRMLTTIFTEIEMKL